MTSDPNASVPLNLAYLHDRLCDRFDDQWKACIAGAPGAARPSIEEWLKGEPEPMYGVLFGHLLGNELERRREMGESPDAAEYLLRFPKHAHVVHAVFAQTVSQPVPKPDSRRSSEARRRDARYTPGTLIAKRYRIVAKLGQGGMGEVYHADDQKLGEPVALKFLREDRSDDPKSNERFRDEVTVARMVTHKNVCRVHDLDEHTDGTRFLVMEYASAGSLVAQLELRPGKRFGPDDVTAYARQLCDGLAAVHECELLHRDLKPGNVLLSKDGTVKLADFGLAAPVENLTPDEVGAGTVVYMAPEQLKGDDVTVRSDLFALGLTLYELLTGSRPFPGTTRQELLRQHADTTLPRPPSQLVNRIDPALEKAILWCLELDPEKRPASAREVRDALPLHTPKEVANLVPSKPLRKWVALTLLGGVLLGLLSHAVIADRTMAYRQLPAMKSRDFLDDRAKELAGQLADTQNHKARHNGFEWDLDLVKDVAHKRPAGWSQSEAGGRSPLVYFWYRSGPNEHPPSNRVTPADPPLVAEGMVCVLLDYDGRLLEYHAVPSRGPKPPDARTRDECRDHWEKKLLGASKLKPSDFVRVPPRRRPAVFADDVWSLDEVGGTGKRVDLATCDGSPVYFRVAEPFADAADRPDRAEGENVAAQAQRKPAGYGASMWMLMLAVAAAGPVAYRNWTRGRVDMSGALRVVGLYAAAALVGWVFITTHSASLHVERVMLMDMFGIMSFWGLTLLVVYLAVEPYMRRRWPERLSSWNRALSGRLRDPLVGRDVLVGVLAGVCFAIPTKLVAPLLGTFYLVTPVYEPLTPNVPPGLVATMLSMALLRTAGTFVLLLLLGLLLRREWAAAVVVIGLVAFGTRLQLPTFPENSPLTWLGAVAFGSLVVLTAVRFGWLAVLVGVFTSSVLTIFPLTFAPHKWYTDATLTAVVALLALAGYGFFVSLRGQKWFSDDA